MAPPPAGMAEAMRVRSFEMRVLYLAYIPILHTVSAISGLPFDAKFYICPIL
jgi:hypothetical protein